MKLVSSKRKIATMVSGLKVSYSYSVYLQDVIHLDEVSPYSGIRTIFVSLLLLCRCTSFSPIWALLRMRNLGSKSVQNTSRNKYIRERRAHRYGSICLPLQHLTKSRSSFAPSAQPVLLLPARQSILFSSEGYSMSWPSTEAALSAAMNCWYRFPSGAAI